MITFGLFMTSSSFEHGQDFEFEFKFKLSRLWRNELFVHSPTQTATSYTRIIVSPLLRHQLTFYHLIRYKHEAHPSKLFRIVFAND